MSDEYTFDDAHDRARQRQMDKFNREEADRLAREVRLSCAHCSELIPKADRGAGVRFCSPACESIDAHRGKAGDLTFVPRTSDERQAHRKALRGKQYAGGHVR